MIGQMADDPLDHGLLDYGQHLFGRGQGQWPQAGALPADQDNCPHFLVPPELFVVVDVEAAVVGVVALVVGVVAAGVGVAGAVVDVEELSNACSSAVMARAGGLGTLAVAGTNAAVIIWPLANSRSCGSPLVSVPLPFDSGLDQVSTMTTPGLPESGVPLGHTSPLV